MSNDVKTMSSRLVQISENAILLVIGLATLYASGVEVKRLFDSGDFNRCALCVCLCRCHPRGQRRHVRLGF